MEQNSGLLVVLIPRRYTSIARVKISFGICSARRFHELPVIKQISRRTLARQEFLINVLSHVRKYIHLHGFDWLCFVTNEQPHFFGDFVRLQLSCNEGKYTGNQFSREHGAPSSD
jgi:hypothetical protein